MINSMSFRNFKGLRNVTTPLGHRFCVLVGPNGAGKTSVLEGIHFLARCTSGRPSDIFSGALDSRRLSFNGGDGNFEIAATGDGRTLAIRSENRGTNVSPIFWNSVDDAAFVATEDNVGFIRDRSLFDVFGRCVLLKLDASELARPSVGGLTRLESDGSGLASVLASLKLNDDDRFDQIKLCLKEVVPAVESLHIEQRPVYDNTEKTEKPGFALFFKTASATGIPADLMSEGTLLVLGLLTVVLGSPSPRIILMDDIDRALHPRAQFHLVQLIRSLLKQMPDLQIIATSHSPYLIDAMELDEVVLTSSDSVCGTICKRLSDHPDARKWKDATETGEFWTMVGEEWMGNIAGVTP